MEIIFPRMAVQTAAFRPDRGDTFAQAPNDYGWLTFFGVASTAFVQMVIIGIVILQDTRPTPVFPRWAGYLKFWAGLALTSGTVCVYFKSGPLAWTGVFNFWIPFTAFFIWLIAMAWLLIKAVDHETAEEADPPVATSSSDSRFTALTQQLADVTDELDSMRSRLARVEQHPVP